MKLHYARENFKYFLQSENTPLTHGSLHENVPRNVQEVSLQNQPYPMSQFQYLHPSRVLSKPNLSSNVSRDVHDAFQSVYQSYGHAFTIRQKIDTCLANFEQLFDLPQRVHMSAYFRAWKSALAVGFPQFKITFSGNFVKMIEVETSVMPPKIKTAEESIQDLLQACHIFLEQYDFNQNSIEEGLGRINVIIANLSKLTSNLQPGEQQQLVEYIPDLQRNYERTIGFVSMFKADIETLLQEITESAQWLN